MSQSDLYIKNYKHYKDKEIILYPHLGLGDMIICNGLVNKLSNYFSKILFNVSLRFLTSTIKLRSESFSHIT